MMKKLLAVIVSLAIIATIVPVVFADNNVVVSLSDFESFESGTVMKHQEKLSNGWMRQGADNTGEIAMDSTGNKYAKLITTTGYNELIRDFNVSSEYISITGRTIFHDNYVQRAVYFKDQNGESAYIYFNTDRTVKVANNALADFEYKDNVWYDFTIDMELSNGRCILTITDPDGKSYTNYNNFGAKNYISRLDFVTPNADATTASEWGVDDVKVNAYVVKTGFNHVSTGKITSGSKAGWTYAANSGSNGYVNFVKGDDGNKYVEFVPGSKISEFYYTLSSSNTSSSYTNPVNVSFRTMFKGNRERKLMLRASSESYYLTFNANGTLNVGNKVVPGFTYKENVWYDVSVNFNHLTGYTNVTVSDGVNSYKGQGYGATQTGGLIRLNFVQDAGVDSTSWIIDDVTLHQIDAAEPYYEPVVLIDNETFSGFTPNDELVGTTSNGWKVEGDVDSGTSVKVVDENNNQYMSITAGAKKYTQFYKEFTAMNDANKGYKLKFSIKFNDFNHAKSIYLRGEGGENEYIIFRPDQCVQLVNHEGDVRLIPNFKYNINTWYDFEALFNPANGQMYLSVKDGENTYGTWGNGLANSGLYRVNFLVNNKLDEGTTTYCVDNINLEEAEAMEWNAVNLSEISYSVDAITSGEIKASVNGIVHGTVNCNLFLAVYSKEGRELVGIDFVPIKAEGYVKDFVAEVTVPSNYENYEVRAFLFDESLVPVQTVSPLK